MRDYHCYTTDAANPEDAAAFTNIYNNYNRLVNDAAYHICRCKLLSQEITQEIFLKLWVNKDHINEIRDIDNYLFMITKNLALDHLRRQQLEQSVFKEYSFLISKDLYVEESQAREMQKLMQEAVEQLHPQQKRIYQLKRHYGWKRDRIAKQLNISENTVKATMQKALHSVKQYVKERVV